MTTNLVGVVVAMVLEREVSKVVRTIMVAAVNVLGATHPLLLVPHLHKFNCNSKRFGAPRHVHTLNGNPH